MKILNKTPYPIKIIFTILFCLFTIFKLLGYKINDLFNTELTLVYFKTFYFVVIFIIILYILIHLLLLHILHKKNNNTSNFT